ncbi:MAG: TIGR02301 family protein [Robiginitomaculum sp.]|nr:MAG: TIGR02301 family protein [Robiginitomaculum sp.]
MKRILLIWIFLLAGLTAFATAQTDDNPVDQEQDSQPKLDPETVTRQIETRIDENMMSMTGLVEAMANNLGQLHFLRTLCFGSDDQKWRRVAADMMRIEAPDNPSYHRQLIQAFNAGYYAQKDRTQACSQTVALDVAALSENGRRLSVMLGDPYRER